MVAAVGQSEWRFCTKCLGLFFNGLANKGVCPAGQHHTPEPGHGGAQGPASWDYMLVADPVPFPGV
jgi:hypothetical protein